MASIVHYVFGMQSHSIPEGFTAAVQNSTTQQVVVTSRDVYGNTLLYPTCTTAKLFAALVGKKTLSERDLNLIAALGFEIIKL